MTQAHSTLVHAETPVHAHVPPLLPLTCHTLPHSPSLSGSLRPQGLAGLQVTTAPRCSFSGAVVHAKPCDLHNVPYLERPEPGFELIYSFWRVCLHGVGCGGREMR